VCKYIKDYYEYIFSLYSYCFVDFFEYSCDLNTEKKLLIFTKYKATFAVRTNSIIQFNQFNMTSRGIFHKFTVDALNICYIIQQDTFNELTNSQKEIWGFNYNPRFKKEGDAFDFLLVRMEKTKLRFELRVLDDKIENNYLRFGTLRLSPRIEDFDEVDEADIQNRKENVNFDDYSSYCFIQLDNNIFYSRIMTYFEPVGVKKTNISKKDFAFEKRDLKLISKWGMETSTTKPKNYIKHEINSVFMVNLIANFLGLRPYCVVNLEIACDTNINYVKHISKALRNKNIVVNVNNHEYDTNNSDERIKGMFYFFSASRKEKQNQSIYVTQSHKQLQIKFYDKTQELIFNSSYKTYINERYNKACEIHRAEVTARKNKIEKFYNEKKISLDEFIFDLCDEEYLFEPFVEWSNALIKFRTVKMKKGESFFKVLDLLKLTTKSKTD